ncbi:SRPBCC family protein [Bradyrhizobium sp. WSM 1704]|uniref:SRPBCC family protein n=1 Tax=Bradyrhizobium semiaridum TaxID=2821404 RepID=UPI001CE2E45D|nr:SRPBCC family protein [Bradyrhizobium semiaridum]MCA6123457.1 SRPBCC family protein [Bradyrhizobium semiaridum]
MRLSDSVTVSRTAGEIFRFMTEPQNLARWDRSVVKVIETSSRPVNVGTTFDTIGPSIRGKEGLKTSYEVLRIEPDRHLEVRVTHSNFFKTAVWCTELEPLGEATRLVCAVDLTLRLRYLPLAPVLLLNKGAITRDLGYLKAELERGDIVS